jgi:hypothetical protein
MPKKDKDKISAAQIIELLIPDIFIDSHLRPSEFILKYWNEYKSFVVSIPSEKRENRNSLNGMVFEILIQITLIRENIFPFYLQAKLAFIPSAIYDILFFTKEVGFIVLSLKVSMRERWKQTDLEAVALNNIHRESKTYLISLNKKEVKARKAKIKSTMAIENFILATDVEYDRFLEELQLFRFSEAPVIKVVESTQSLVLDTKSWRV